MKYLKIFMITGLCCVFLMSCQTNSNQKKVAELTEDGWEMLHHWEGKFQPGDDISMIAANKFEQAIALDSNYVPALAGLSSQYISAKSAEIGRNKAIAEAKKLAQKAIQLDPDYAPAFVARGAVEVQERDIKAAKATFEKALALDPANVDALRQYSDLKRWSEGDYAKALELAEKAVKADPRNSNAKRTLAQAYRFQDRLDEALAWIDEALNEHKAGIFFIEKGNILYFKKDYDAAITVLNEGIAIYPKRKQLRSMLAWSYVKKDMYDKAIPLFKELNWPWMLGWAYGSMGEKDKAVEILVGLKQNYEQGESNEWGIACVYFAINDHENAIKYFEKSLEQAVEKGWFGDYKYFITHLDEFRGLLANPRFQALLEKVNTYQVNSSS